MVRLVIKAELRFAFLDIDECIYVSCAQSACSAQEPCKRDYLESSMILGGPLRGRWGLTFNREFRRRVLHDFWGLRIFLQPLVIGPLLGPVLRASIV